MVVQGALKTEPRVNSQRAGMPTDSGPGDEKPVAIAGNARVFEEGDLERISAALREMDSRRDSHVSTPTTARPALKPDRRQG
jgi:hypothetical protein